MFALVQAFRAFRDFIWGRHIRVIIDSKVLMHMGRSSVAMVQQWYAYIQQYDFELIHFIFEQNALADGLTRCVSISAPAAPINYSSTRPIAKPVPFSTPVAAPEQTLAAARPLAKTPKRKPAHGQHAIGMLGGGASKGDGPGSKSSTSSPDNIVVVSSDNDSPSLVAPVAPASPGPVRKRRDHHSSPPVSSPISSMQVTGSAAAQPPHRDTLPTSDSASSETCLPILLILQT
jgi:hypothetical protein